MTTVRIVLAFVLVVLFHTGAAAQGLIAFPWKTCPTVDEKPRCVWVVASGRLLPIRFPEHEEGNFHLEFLNPGPGSATVAIQVRSRAGVFQREQVFEEVLPGELMGAPALSGEPAARVHGYVVVRSDQPLLLWAWAFGQHFRGGGATEAAWTYSLQVIPVDCGDPDAAKTFSFVCIASGGPPPPQ